MNTDDGVLKSAATIPALGSLFSFLVSWGGVRLNALGTSATNLPIASSPDDR
jgi:hypothetical protein